MYSEIITPIKKDTEVRGNLVQSKGTSLGSIPRGVIIGVSSSGKTPDSDSGIRRFESYYPSLSCKYETLTSFI